MHLLGWVFSSFLSTLGWVLPGSEAPQLAELQKAEETFFEASQKRNETQRLLNQTYRFLESFFKYYRSDGARTPLVETLAEMGREAQEEWLANPPVGLEEESRKNRLQIFYRKNLFSKLLRGGQFPPTLIGPVVRRMASSMAKRKPHSKTDLTEEAESALTALLNPQFSFSENWNRILYREIPEGRNHEKAEREYARALRKMERLRRPDRFHPAYRNIPEGMILIPEETYSLGENKGWDLDSNRTQKEFFVQLGAFYIDRYEVTNRKYRKFLESRASEEGARRTPTHWIQNSEGAFLIPPGKGDYPVTGVSWEDAAAYATWAGKRLPTENEWEAAARGFQSLVYPWGNTFEAWRPNYRHSGRNASAPVGMFRGDRSPYGCFDMAGNVMEWTSSSPAGKTARRLKENTNMILRGGSFKKSWGSASAIYRWAYPGITTREPDIGFRCVQDIR